MPIYICEKSAAVWNQTRDLLYYTPHVYPFEADINNFYAYVVYEKPL